CHARPNWTIPRIRKTRNGRTSANSTNDCPFSFLSRRPRTAYSPSSSSSSKTPVRASTGGGGGSGLERSSALDRAGNRVDRRLNRGAQAGPGDSKKHADHDNGQDQCVLHERLTPLDAHLGEQNVKNGHAVYLPGTWFGASRPPRSKI